MPTLRRIRSILTIGIIARLCVALALLDAAGALAWPTQAQDTSDPSVTGGSVPRLVQFPAGNLTLSGWLWQPPEDGPFPTVLYNHGSEPLPGWKPTIAPTLVNAGYVFFVPHRRGQGRSPGPYVQDQISQAPPDQRQQLQVSILEDQVHDQLGGLDYLRTLPFVDQGRLAVMGCSYGGIQTILGSEANPGYRAAVDFSGAAQSWGNPLLRDRLIKAIQKVSIPVFFIHPENDYTVEPGRALAAELERLGKPYRLEIFPPVGTTPEEGHCFNGAQGGADLWGPDVLDFLAQNLQ